MVISQNSFRLNFFIKFFITALPFAGNSLNIYYYIKKPNFMQDAIKSGSLRITGVEPARGFPPEPKSGASANSAISAWLG